MIMIGANTTMTLMLMMTNDQQRDADSYGTFIRTRFPPFEFSLLVGFPAWLEVRQTNLILKATNYCMVVCLSFRKK